jgi:hypothetical protein
MLGSVIAFAAVFTGPWGWLKSAAFTIGSKAWMGYAAGFLSLNLLLLPGIFVFMTWAGEGGARKVDALKKAISTQAQGLIPLGLMAWIAFTISFALPKLNTIFSVMNDPFGWGWRLLGSAGSSLTMNISGISAGIEVVLLLVGLFWSVNVGSRINTRAGKPARRVNFPVLAFSLGFTLVMMGLLIG